MGAGLREQIETQNFRMSGAGLRVLGVAYRWDPADAAAGGQDGGWVWSGLVGLKDPVRRNARTVVRALHRAGIRTVVITGDQGLTAHRIGEELGLAGAEALRILDAVDLKSLSREGLRSVVTRTHVFARLSPAQKLQVIQAYQNVGLSVVMVGDGFNDVLALKVADVGIAMGRRGAELAKRTADLVLEDDNLEGILRAIANGRAFYGNIRRSLAFVLAAAHMDLSALASRAGGLAAPSPLQSIWWSNLACLQLALEPAEPDRMNRPPDPEDAMLLTDEDTRDAVADALRATAAAALAGGLESVGLGAGAFGRSVAVNQMLYAAACRANGDAGRPPNRLLEADQPVGRAAGTRSRRWQRVDPRPPSQTVWRWHSGPGFRAGGRFGVDPIEEGAARRSEVLTHAGPDAYGQAQDGNDGGDPVDHFSPPGINVERGERFRLRPGRSPLRRCWWSGPPGAPGDGRSGAG